MRAHFENSCNQFQMGFEINIKKNLWRWPLSRSISFGRTTSPFWRRNHFGFFYLLTILPKSKAKLSCQWHKSKTIWQLNSVVSFTRKTELSQAELSKVEEICSILSKVELGHSGSPKIAKNVLQLIMGRIMCNYSVKCFDFWN